MSYFHGIRTIDSIINKKDRDDNMQNAINIIATIIVSVGGTGVIIVAISKYIGNILAKRIEEKYKNKLADQKQAASVFKKEFIEKEFEDEEEIKIIRSKKFDIKPMYPEDACIQMELLGHSFFVFCNAETDQVNVVYKRKGNTYGLIEPEL